MLKFTAWKIDLTRPANGQGSTNLFFFPAKNCHSKYKILFSTKIATSSRTYCKSNGDFCQFEIRNMALPKKMRVPNSMSNEYVAHGALSNYKYFHRNTIRYHFVESNVCDRSSKLNKFIVNNGVELIQNYIAILVVGHNQLQWQWCEQRKSWIFSKSHKKCAPFGTSFAFTQRFWEFLLENIEKCSTHRSIGQSGIAHFSKKEFKFPLRPNK